MSFWASQTHAFHQPVCQRLSWLHHWSVPHVHTIEVFSPSEWGPDPQCQAAQVDHWTWWWQCLVAWHCRSVWSLPCHFTADAGGSAFMIKYPCNVKAASSFSCTNINQFAKTTHIFTWKIPVHFRSCSNFFITALQKLLTLCHENSSVYCKSYSHCLMKKYQCLAKATHTFSWKNISVLQKLPTLFHEKISVYCKSYSHTSMKKIALHCKSYSHFFHEKCQCIAKTVHIFSRKNSQYIEEFLHATV